MVEVEVNDSFGVVDDDNTGVERSLLSPRVTADLETTSTTCVKDHNLAGCCGAGYDGCTRSYSGKAKDAKDCYKSHGGGKKDYGACQYKSGDCECYSKCKPEWHPKKSKGTTVCYEPISLEVAVGTCPEAWLEKSKCENCCQSVFPNKEQKKDRDACKKECDKHPDLVEDAKVHDAEEAVERSLLSPRVAADLETTSTTCVKDHNLAGCCGAGYDGCTRSYSGKAKDAKDCYKSHGGGKKDYGACQYKSGDCECYSKCKSDWHPKKSKGTTVCYEPKSLEDVEVV